MCSFGLFCISLVGWIETLGELSQIVRAQILVCDTWLAKSRKFGETINNSRGHWTIA